MSPNPGRRRSFSAGKNSSYYGGGEEYGRLVEGEVPAAVRLGVDMSKLMTPDETGKAIRDALRSTSGAAGAHRWIVDETSVWLYGD
jgi:hypothetical protein